MSKPLFYLLLLLLCSATHQIQAQEADTLLAHQYLSQAEQLIEDRDLPLTIQLLEKAASIYAKLPDWKNWTKTTGMIQESYYLQGEYEKAITLLDSALAVIEKPLGKQSIGYNQLLLDKAKNIYEQGQFRESIALVEGLLPSLISWFGESSELVGKAYQVLADVYSDVGAPDRSLEFSLKNLQLQERTFGNDHLRLAKAFDQVGSSYIHLKRFEDALTYIQRAVESRLQVFQDGFHPDFGNSYSHLGICYTSLGEIEKAESYFLKAYAIKKRVYGEIHPEVADFLWNLGMFYRFAKDPGKSLEIFLQELAIRQELALEGPHLTENYKRIGHAYIELGRHKEALLAIQLALESLAKGFSDTDFHQNPTAKQISLKQQGLRVASNKLIAWYFYLQEVPDDKEGIDSSLQLAELCLQLWEAVRAEMQQQELSKQVSARVVRRAVQYASLIAFQGYRLTGAEAYRELAFSLAERGKALLLQDVYIQAEAKQSSARNTDILTQEEQLSQQLAQYESQLLTAIQANDSLQIDHLRNDLIFDLKTEYAAFTERVSVNHPGYYELNYRPLPLSSNEVRPLLQKDHILVEYLLQKDAKKLLTFVLQKDSGLQLFESPLPADINQITTAYYKLLRSYQLNRGDKKRKFIQLSHKLYQLLIEPIKGQLKGKKKLTIIGEAFTHYIPFETLLSSPEGKSFPEMDFLVKEYEISYHYSAGLWAASQRQDRKYEYDFIGFAPVFDISSPNENAAQQALDTTMRSVDKTGAYTPLQYSEKEVKQIADLLIQQNQQAMKVLLREQATEANLKSALEQQYRYIHLASHSFSNLRHPNLSGIACLPTPQEEIENGILFSGEIYNMRIQSELLVLSSCESGVGKIISGDGMLGLNRSFVAAGVPNVVFSLWKVFDRFGSEMMVEFYREILEKGESYASALRKAKLKFLAKKNSASPEFWGAYLLIGR